MSTTAPALGGASTSNAVLHSAWNPYAVLPPTTRRKVDPAARVPARSFLTALGIPSGVAADRIGGKYLQLETPEGKVSDRRRAELKKRGDTKERQTAKVGDCGLVGRRKRKALAKAFEGRVRYDSVLPVHELWLGYMAELLALPVQLPAQSTAAEPTKATSVLLPTFPPRPTGMEDASAGLDLKINAPVMQAKLVKAEFVGCKLSVKRAKNPSMLGITGIVLQETLGTFKVVTPKSEVKVLSKKGSVFSFTLPLVAPASAPMTTAREISFDIYGDAFAYRSSDRVGKKWKAGSGPGGVELL